MAKIKKTPLISGYGKLMFGIGDFGYAMVTNTVSSFLMFFGTVICGVPGTLMGLVTALSTAWDAVTDPIVGHYSDRSKSVTFGRRHGFILASIFGVTLSNVLLWSVPLDIPMIYRWLWLLVSMIIYDLFTTFYATPSSALSVEIADDYTERAKIQSVRSVFMLIGTIVPIVLMSVLQSANGNPYGQYDPTSYTKMSYIAGCCMLICGITSFFTTYSSVPRLRERSKDQKEKGKISISKIFKNFFTVLKKPLYKNLILGYMISMIAASFLTSAGMHVLTYTFRMGSTEMYMLIAGLFLMTIFSQPLWILIVKRFDKKTAIVSGIFTALLGIAGLLAVFLMRAEIISSGKTFVSLLPCLAVAGVGVGALYSMPTAMMGDAVAVEKVATKVESTGTYTGFMTLAYKLSQAIASLIIGVLLDVIGFNSSATTQPVGVESGLGLMLIVGMSLALIGGLVFYSRYNLKKSDVPNFGEEQEVNKVIKDGAISTQHRADDRYINWD